MGLHGLLQGELYIFYIMKAKLRRTELMDEERREKREERREKREERREKRRSSSNLKISWHRTRRRRLKGKEMKKNRRRYKRRKMEQ
jgi:hypothetical protein